MGSQVDDNVWIWFVNVTGRFEFHASHLWKNGFINFTLKIGFLTEDFWQLSRQSYLPSPFERMTCVRYSMCVCINDFQYSGFTDLPSSLLIFKFNRFKYAVLHSNVYFWHSNLDFRHSSIADYKHSRVLLIFNTRIFLIFDTRIFLIFDTRVLMIFDARRLLIFDTQALRSFDIRLLISDTWIFWFPKLEHFCLFPNINCFKMLVGICDIMFFHIRM